MEAVLGALRKAATSGSRLAAEVLEQWEEPLAVDGISEDFLGIAIIVLAQCAIGGEETQSVIDALPTRRDALEGLEDCLALASSAMPPDSVGRLQASVLERTLSKFDQTADLIASMSSASLLMPGSSSLSSAQRAPQVILKLLLRCLGPKDLSGRELLDLFRGDVALSVATLTDALANPSPAGLRHWHLRIAKLLQQLTAMDSLVFLVQRSDPSLNFNDVPMEEFASRRVVHARAIALSFVQFQTLDRAAAALQASEQRQAILTEIMRTLHNLVAGHSFSEPGKLLSRVLALDFARFGFRFFAPYIRKVLEASEASDSAKLLRMSCSTLSWLLFHTEGERFLADSLRPLAAEWTLRCDRLGQAPTSLMALLGLCASCGALSSDWPGSAPLMAQLPAISHKLQNHESCQSPTLGSPWRRCLGPLTARGSEDLSSLGFVLPEECGFEAGESDYGSDDDMDSPEKDGYMLLDGDSDEEGEESQKALGMTEGPPRFCGECKRCYTVGNFGEGYFSTIWYCRRCWGIWQNAPPEEQGLGPAQADPSEDLGVSRCTPEQQGAARLLLIAPSCLRCGISGQLLQEAPVRVPDASQASCETAFERHWLEKWHRRSKGRCPLTGRPLNMSDVKAAPELAEEVQSWIRNELEA
mmetsp:Transcript_90443/g.198102  ORF Transcript_90443/g.198102 Transcript_90443/m.198102 type:complete len:643 (+) Transcript_90443:61-1989(+)